MSLDSSSNYKKYAVVPYDMLNNLSSNFLPQQQQQPIQYQNLLIRPELRNLGNLDLELKSVLNDNSIPADIKYKKYSELINKYSIAMGNFLNKPPLEIEIKESQKPRTETSSQVESYVTVGSVLEMAKLPGNLSAPGRMLIDKLYAKSNPNPSTLDTIS